MGAVVSDDLEGFSTAIGTGMRRVPAPPVDHAAQAALRARLAEYDIVRSRAAVDARFVPILPRNKEADRRARQALEGADQ